jgi:hypothetical protein
MQGLEYFQLTYFNQIQLLHLIQEIYFWKTNTYLHSRWIQLFKLVT